MGTMPPDPARVRRENVALLLQITSSTCLYASGQLSNGVGPDEARRVVLETSAELALLAVRLQRLASPDPATRRAQAWRLAADGTTSTREIAERLGVNERTVRKWLHRARPDVSSAQ